MPSLVNIPQAPEAPVIPIEEQINQELVKHNVTETLIADLKQMYMPLVLKDLNDKETYVAIKEGRKHCKQVRVTAEKLCKKGREDANAISKAWVAKEKDVAGRIGEVEDHLEKQEKEFEAEQEKQKALRKRQQEEQLIRRQTQLTNMGALYSDGSFVLGEVSFELSLVKECEDDIWAEQIFPKFHAEYEKVEAERIESDRKKKEQEEELKRQQEDMERKQRELEQREADLKKAEEERLQREREEQERRDNEAKEKMQKKVTARCSELSSLGLTHNPNEKAYIFEDINVHWVDLATSDDDEWAAIIGEINPAIQQKKKDYEEKRLAEIEEQKIKERIRAAGESRMKSLNDIGYEAKDVDILGEYTDEEYDLLYATAKNAYDYRQKEKWGREQEEKKKLEELKEAQRLLEASEKEKWQDVLTQLDALVIHKFRSGQYARKAAILREKLEEVKAL